MAARKHNCKHQRPDKNHQFENQGPQYSCRWKLRRHLRQAEQSQLITLRRPGPKQFDPTSKLRCGKVEKSVRPEGKRIGRCMSNISPSANQQHRKPQAKGEYDGMGKASMPCLRTQYEDEKKIEIRGIGQSRADQHRPEIIAAAL